MSALLAAAAAAAAAPEAEPLRASFAPLLTAVPWREAVMLASPLVGTALLRRGPRR